MLRSCLAQRRPRGGSGSAAPPRERKREQADGKGVRAVLHAAFTFGLAEYCYDEIAEHLVVTAATLDGARSR